MTAHDTIVYEAPGSNDYVAHVGELGWLRWPSKEDGWAERKPCAASLADTCRELPPFNAWLAFKLSGATL